MKKKLLSVIMSAAVVASLLAGCGAAAGTAAPAADAAPAATDAAAPAADTTEAAAPAAANGKKVAVAMPTQSSERWMHDGANMKSQLEELGYEVDLQYAEDDVKEMWSA